MGVFLESSHFYSKFVVKAEHEQDMLFRWVQIVEIKIKFHLILKPIILFLSQIAAVFRNKKENIQPGVQTEGMLLSVIVNNLPY